MEAVMKEVVTKWVAKAVVWVARVAQAERLVSVKTVPLAGRCLLVRDLVG